LVKNFGNILDYNFTAKVEQDFDEIAEGKCQLDKDDAKFCQNYQQKKM
jgi:DNA topoisomerase-1